MTTILFPTDFSTNANHALEYAVNIANATGASIHLLHVYTPLVSPANSIHAFITDETDDIKKTATEKLAVLCKAIQEEYPGIVCQPHVAIGETVETILDTALEYKSDMIIMGTRGASNLTKILFGSNTSSVIEGSKSPVLCVPSNSVCNNPKKMLFATNFSPLDMHEIQKLVPIAKAFNSEIIVGHVDVSLDEDSEESNEMKNFTKDAIRATGYSKISFRLVNDHNVSMGLDKIIEESGIDLFALSTHKRSWFEKFTNPSLTKKISHYATIPMLAFHNP